MGEIGDNNYEEQEKHARERVRKYQVNRLRYYYAVAEFMTADAADSVYKACDGSEYELSGTRFDLRFIPDDTSFDDQPTDSCIGMPDPETYKPKCFFNTALMQGKVNLTWDETDPEREAAMKRAFDLADNDNDDINAYLAMSSDGEAENSDTLNSKECIDSADEEQIGEMEMNFVSNDAVNGELHNPNSNDESDNIAPWDKYLLKKKEKQKMKREARKKAQEALIEDSETEEPKDVKRKRKKKQNIENEESNEFSLLVMDSDDDKEHFDYKEIVKNETKQSKKRRKKEEKLKKTQEENFKLDLGDERFSAVFEKPDYNIDPSHPNFKKTQCMLDMVEEKQRRIKKHGKNKKETPPNQKVNKEVQAMSNKSHTSTGLSSDINRLVNSVHRKSSKKSKGK